MISVVIRTKNEEKWIDSCLFALTKQSAAAVEIILVDNFSTDATVSIAKKYPCTIIDISDQDFSFGRAINRGIEASKGSLVAILSGHCVPLNDQWLQCLAAPFNDAKVAAVYGRQEPLPDTSPFDKRDLWTTFGIERKTQNKDFFFHNANSMIRRDLWEAIPFDEQISGVEDRDWAKKVLGRGYRIIYEPMASVYHHHGIHHARDEKRASRVARVIELINNKSGQS